jgi:hypothetical protein
MTQRTLPAGGVVSSCSLPLAFHTVSMVFTCQTVGFGVHTSFLPEELLDDPIDLRGGNRLFQVLGRSEFKGLLTTLIVQ